MKREFPLEATSPSTEILSQLELHRISKPFLPFAHLGDSGANLNRVASVAKRVSEEQADQDVFEEELVEMAMRLDTAEKQAAGLIVNNELARTARGEDVGETKKKKEETTFLGNILISILLFILGLLLLIPDCIAQGPDLFNQNYGKICMIIVALLLILVAILSLIFFILCHMEFRKFSLEIKKYVMSVHAKSLRLKIRKSISKQPSLTVSSILPSIDGRIIQTMKTMTKDDFEHFFDISSDPDEAKDEEEKFILNLIKTIKERTDLHTSIRDPPKVPEDVPETIAPDNFYDILFSGRHLKVTFLQYRKPIQALVPNGFDLELFSEDDLKDIVPSKLARVRILHEACQIIDELRSRDKEDGGIKKYNNRAFNGAGAGANADGKREFDRKRSRFNSRADVRTLDGDEMKVHLAILELIETEKHFLEELKLINSMFLVPLREGGFIEQDSEIAPMENVVNDLIHGSSWLCHSLVKAHSILEVFLLPQMKDVMKTFTKYLDIFDIWTPWLDAFRKTKKGEHFLHGRRSPGGIFITPIQRPPRYLLLLGEMRKRTSPEHDAYEDLLIVIDLITTFVEYTNTVQSQNSLRKDLSLRFSDMVSGTQHFEISSSYIDLPGLTLRDVGTFTDMRNDNVDELPHIDELSADLRSVVRCNRPPLM